MVKLLHLLYAKQQQQLQATQERQQKEEEESHRLLNLFSQQDAKARTEEEDTLAIILALGYLGTPGYHSVQTAWASLWRSQSDRAFITTMGMDVATFDDLLSHFAGQWNFSTIDQANVNRHGKPQIGQQLLDAAGCLGLVLHWLCLTMVSYTLQQLFAITPAVCCIICQRGCNIFYCAYVSTIRPAFYGQLPKKKRAGTAIKSKGSFRA
ncbi:hypothetical protein PCASD_09594 [Puccinia coronata f. sp. avenae]|uniref:Uncharacterized protein n=1 Tax=Puccinia coronata f. sp. avenae TaxID=200324 RepID=A0A2N5UPS3_9BASI|nr:hypothetical protein PCASD_09594 [Puccinia coronata f. sp. avenae]